MATVGIICEYNPFHAGHARQIAEVRRRMGEDTAIVCAMSGNFVQRGDFAVCRKQIRAEAALAGGADLVLELPLPWAIASAEGFARGAVAVLAASGVVDTLAFGSECGDTAALCALADCLDSAAYQEEVRKALVSGASFASCRQSAVRALLGGGAELLDGANNNLGVEYCRALRRLDCRIVPLALPRFGAQHDGEAAEGIASASQIRQLLLSGQDASPYLTERMRALLRQETDAGRAPVSRAFCERAMLARFRQMEEADFARFDGGGEGLYHRLYRESRRAAGIDELLDAVKTKRYAASRLRRMLLAAYLGVEPEAEKQALPYLRVLAVGARGRTLLRQMKSAASLPVLVKPADVRQLSPSAQALFEKEARATDLYTLAYPDLSAAAGGSEWETDPVVQTE